MPVSSASSRSAAVARRLARVDAALRHLPGRLRVVEPLAGEDAPRRVQEHDPDAGPIGQREDLRLGHAEAHGLG